MDRMLVKIGDLKFELILPEDAEDMPVLEIENEASIVFETMDVGQAIQLKELIDRYLYIARDS